jgi:hypothetical protein
MFAWQCKILGRLCFAAILFAPVAAQSAAMVTVYGIGASSCAHWLSSPENESEGKSWILGYWSASNEVNPNRHTVGGNSDSDAIIGETKKVCTSEPSTRLIDAVGRVYFQFQKNGK